MCMIDACDINEFYHARNPTARKEHTCDECGRTIEVGEKYESVVAKSDGQLWSCKTCRHCVAVREWLREVCGGWVHHAVLEDLHEHLHESLNPRWISVAIACAGKGWKGPDGKFYREMKLPNNMPGAIY